MAFRSASRLGSIVLAVAWILAPGKSLTAAQKSINQTNGARLSKSQAGRVQSGLETLEVEKFAALKGKRIGLITNHTGQDSQGRSTVDLLAHAAGVQLVALFSPEHGIAGHADEKISSSNDPSTGMPV